jgi:hypothetical protein
VDGADATDLSGQRLDVESDQRKRKCEQQRILAVKADYVSADACGRIGRHIVVRRFMLECSMPALAAAFALAVSGLVVPAAEPVAVAPAAAAPGIVVLNVTGSGCRPNTTAAALSSDRTALTIIYSNYVVSAAGSTKTVSKNCRVNLKVDAVPGYAPRITSVDYRGFADVATGSVVELAATYGFHGAAHLESAALRVAGPFSDGWLATDAAEGGLVTGRCHGSNVLDVDSRLSLTSTSSGAASDFTAMDSTDGVVPNTFHLTWTRCA